MLYFANQIVIRKHVIGYVKYFANCYLNDIIAGTLIMALINTILLIAYSKKITHILTIVTIIFGIGVFWEYAPHIIKQNSVSDILDIIAYEAGGYIYWIYTNKKENKKDYENRI